MSLNNNLNKILIIDFGSQFTQLIARRIRELGNFSVFVNHKKDFIRLAISEVPLDMIQLHGDETPDFCNQFDVPVLKALRIKDKARFSVMSDFNVDGFLLDTFSNKQYGGTGETFDWSLLNEQIDTPIILSGGLNPDNILDAIDSVNPAAIDVNSGVELSPGKKDHQKINLLFENLKNTNTSGFHFG